MTTESNATPHQAAEPATREPITHLKRLEHGGYKECRPGNRKSFPVYAAPVASIPASISPEMAEAVRLHLEIRAGEDAPIDIDEMLRAALAASPAPRAVAEPGDFVMVPREPTEAMLFAAEVTEPRGYSALYAAMIAAAPAPTPSADAPSESLKDSLRLDWLERHMVAIEQLTVSGSKWWQIFGDDTSEGSTLRKAIDAVLEGR